jgi:AraC-like DNA-binding protein/quercetin dioxygenase-like cupin family protein
MSRTLTIHTQPREAQPVVQAVSSPSVRTPQAMQVAVSHGSPHLGPANSYSQAWLIFLESGLGWYQLGPRKISVGSGDLIMIAPGEVLDLQGLENTRNWVVTFDADWVTPVSPQLYRNLANPLELPILLCFEGIKTGQYQIPQTDRSRWLERLQLLERELLDRLPGYLESVNALMLLLLIDLARVAMPQPEQYSPQYRPLLKQVFHFIDAHYREPIGLSEVARTVGRSPAYLTDLVRRETGRTVVSWIIDRRMAEARRLLLETDYTVQKVAETLGYLDSGHFIRQFRQCHGNTPQTWRVSQSRS